MRNFPFHQYFCLVNIVFYKYVSTSSPILINSNLSNLYQLTPMSKFDNLVSKNLFWSLPRQRLPPNIREYKCEFVIDELQPIGTESAPTERIYLRFTHPQTGSSFQIIVDQFHPPISSIYEAEINIKDQEDPKTTLSQQIQAICFTTVKGYQAPVPQIKEIQFNENSPYSDDEICAYFDIESCYSQSEGDDYVELIDYGPENQKEVRHKVLVYLKNPANRFKKMKEIKAFLKKQKFNVPDNHLKNILTTYCGSHIMDKKKGFLVHEQYLSLDEKNQRRREQQEAERKERQKEMKKLQKRKPAKKETKAEKAGKKTVSITQEEFNQYNNIPSMKNALKDSKQKASSASKQPKKPKGK